jgi:adenosylmethionine-8-amino-7-oxononanoate aminotransferase
LANIAILEREGLISRGQELEDDLYEALVPLKEHPLVGDVRGGVGLMAAVDFDGELLERNPALPGTLAKAIRPHGVLLRALARGLAISPPLVVSPEEIDLISGAIRAGLDDVRESVDVEAAKAAAGS